MMIEKLKNKVACSCMENPALRVDAHAPDEGFLVYPCMPKPRTEGGIVLPEQSRKSALGFIVVAGAKATVLPGNFVVMRSSGPVPMELPHRDGTQCQIPLLYVPEALAVGFVSAPTRAPREVFPDGSVADPDVVDPVDALLGPARSESLQPCGT